jgi:hypothetical protein
MSFSDSGFKRCMTISFRLVKPSRIFNGLEVVKAAGVRVNAAGLGLLDHLVGPLQKRLWNREAQRFRRL